MKLAATILPLTLRPLLPSRKEYSAPRCHSTWLITRCRYVQSHSASCSLSALPGDILRLCEGHHQGHCRVTLVTE